MHDEIGSARPCWIGRRRAVRDEGEVVPSTWLGRIYLDSALSSISFFVLTIAVGKIWRASFDDELDAITAVEHFHPLEMFKAMWGVLLHPPTFYAAFSLFYEAIPNLALLRLFALICSTASVFIFHQMFLNVGHQPTLADRLVGLLAFATVPLLLQFGDAIRWYPIFTLLFALLVLTLARRPEAIWVPAGLLGALSLVNIEGYLITASVCLYRYAVQHRRIIRDLKFLSITALFQAISLPFYYAIFMAVPNNERQLQGYSAVGLEEYYQLIVGFFGGFTFGIGLIWVLLPIFAVTGLALFQLVRRFGETDAIERFALVTFALTAVWASFWTYAYCFIYAALMLTYVVLKLVSRSNSPALKVAFMSALLLTNGAVIGNLQASDHPFFRTYPAPYREMAAAISQNFAPGDLVVSTDPNLVRLLDPRVDCVRVFDRVIRSGKDCTPEDAASSRPTRVWLVEGRRNLIQLFDARNMQSHINDRGPPWEDVVKGLTAGRRLVVSIPYKYDADAALKTRLSGEPLDPFVFSIKILE